MSEQEPTGKRSGGSRWVAHLAVVCAFLLALAGLLYAGFRGREQDGSSPPPTQSRKVPVAVVEAFESDARVCLPPGTKPEEIGQIELRFLQYGSDGKRVPYPLKTAMLKSADSAWKMGFGTDERSLRLGVGTRQLTRQLVVGTEYILNHGDLNWSFVVPEVPAGKVAVVEFVLLDKREGK